MDENISLVGLGKLGLCLAACYADSGFQVLGVDIEERVVDMVNQGKAPLVEPGLDDLIAKVGGKSLKCTTHHSEAIQKSDLTIILVATPSNPDGSFSNRHVESALETLATALGKSSKPYHLFVISSTVMPGSIDSSFIPIIEKYSSRKLNQGFGVAFDPDFVALGNVIKGFKKPDLVVIGESSPECGKRVEALHQKMCENQPAISHMSIISGELAKVCLNAYVTTKISFVNSVANLCEKIPGADVDSITKAIGADKRISPYYFQGGLSFGGTCFPRDTRAYITIGSRYNVQVELIQAVDRINHYQDQHLAEIVMREVVKGSYRSVGIMGLAFTSNTPVITESPAIKLIRELVKGDLRVVAYDPMAIDSTKATLGSAIEYVHSPQSLLEQAHLCVVTLRNKEFKEAIENHHPDRPMTVVDCWRILDAEKLDRQIRYVALGRSE